MGREGVISVSSGVLKGASSLVVGAVRDVSVFKESSGFFFVLSNCISIFNFLLQGF